MVTGIVSNDNYRLASVMQQIRQELQVFVLIHPAIKGPKLHVATRAHRADHVDTEAITAVLHDGCLPNFSPRCATVFIRPDRRFVYEVNNRVALLRKPANLRKRALQIFFNFPRVLLITAKYRTLRTQSHMRQQSTDPAFAQLHGKSSLEQAAHDPQRPQAERKLVLPRVALRDRAVQPAKQPSVDLSRSSCSRSFPKRLFPATTVARQPPEQSCDIHSMNSRDIGHFLSASYRRYRLATLVIANLRNRTGSPQSRRSFLHSRIITNINSKGFRNNYATLNIINWGSTRNRTRPQILLGNRKPAIKYCSVRSSLIADALVS